METTKPSDEVVRKVEKQKRMFLFAGLVLFLGTILTVCIATVPWLDVGAHGFDIWDCALGLSIAALKASVVLLIFMHLNHEKRFIYFIAGLAGIHCMGMIVFTIFSESDSVHDPVFYGEIQHSDPGGVHVAKRGLFRPTLYSENKQRTP